MLKELEIFYVFIYLLAYFLSLGCYNLLFVEVVSLELLGLGNTRFHQLIEKSMLFFLVVFGVNDSFIKSGNVLAVLFWQLQRVSAFCISINHRRLLCVSGCTQN